MSFCGVRVGQFLTSPMGYWGVCGVTIWPSSAMARGERRITQTIAAIAILTVVMGFIGKVYIDVSCNAMGGAQKVLA